MPDENVKPTPALEYAREHASEVYRTNTATPVTFRDLTLVPSKGEITENDVVVPKHFSGSETDKDPVTLSNYESFLEEYAGNEGVYPIEGMNSSYGIAIRISGIDKDMLKTLSSLDDYPSLNDTRAAEKEAEAIMDAWGDWAEYDFTKELENRFPEKESVIDEMTSDEKRRLFDIGKDRAGAHWVSESNGSAYIDVSAIAQEIREADL